MAKVKITKRVYGLNKSLFRELNDIHIYLSHTLPLLDRMAERYRSIKSSSDKRFIVPSRIGKKGIAKRTPEEVASLFEKFAQRELHANLLLVCVSRFESFLNDVLRAFLSEYPGKLSVGLKGGESERQFPVSFIINSTTLAEAQSAVAESRLQRVFYAEPNDYLSYFESITGVVIPETLFLSFVETKATRDLIIHNSGKVNDLYLRKSGKSARGKPGAIIPLNEDYFGKCISVMKSISGEINKQVSAKYEKVAT